MFKLVFFNLFRHKTRTVLSLLGIVIGVAAIISLVSVVDGFFADVTDAVAQVQGVRVLRASGPPIFSKLDASLEHKIASVSGVHSVVPQIIGPIGSLDGRKQSYGNVQIIGVDFVKQQGARSSGVSGDIIEGREIKPSERNVAVIGDGIKKSFNKFVGQKIKVNESSLKIIGVYSTGSQLLNSSILVPIDDARDILDFPSDKVSMFSVDLVNPADAQKVADLLNFRFNGELKAFSSSDLSEQFGDILGSFRLLVVAIAAISAVVAGIGIINTMLMSVLERFKEIGALKAVGWANSDVIKMVLLESLLIGIIGAVFGILLGFAVSSLIGSAFGFNTFVSFELMLQVFVFAVVLGAFGGVYPAFVASKMSPVEALHEE